MPNTVQVRINTINPVVRGNYNMIEVTGYDETNRKGFKKAFFAEKKDGGITANAAAVQPLGRDDWAEFTLDDTSYNNVQTVKAISAPANASAPAQGGGGGGAPQSGGGGTKKPGRSVAMLNREKALDCAVKMIANGTLPAKKAVEAMEKLAYRMEAFLAKGMFDAEVEPEVPVATQAPATQPQESATGEPDPNTAAPIDDDDIPF